MTVRADGSVENMRGECVANVALHTLQRDVEWDGSIKNIVESIFPLEGLDYHELRDTTIQRIGMTEAVDHHRTGGKKTLLCIQAQKGMGKSKAVRHAVRELRPSVSVLSVTFRRTLARGTAKDMGEHATSYLDYDVSDTFNATDHPRLTILINSLLRVDNGADSVSSRHYDVVLIDEVVSVMTMLGSGIIESGQRFRIVQRLCQIINKASLVIVADALIQKDTLQQVYAMLLDAPAAWRIQVLDYTFRNHADWTFYSARNLNEWKASAFQQLERGKRGVFPCMTKKFAIRLRRDIEHAFPHLRVLLYVADSTEHDMEDHMSRVNEIWREWDVVVWSPVITAGCSFEMDHFHFCALQGFQGTCDVNSAVQMTSRVRSLADKAVYVVVSNAPDSFGGVVDAPDELLVRDTWNTALEQVARTHDKQRTLNAPHSSLHSRLLNELAISVHDLVLATAERNNLTRKYRFESEFWKRAAWTGVRMRALTTASVPLIEEPPIDVVRTVKKYSVTPKLYGDSCSVHQLLRRIKRSAYTDLTVLHVSESVKRAWKEALDERTSGALSRATEARFAAREAQRLGLAEDDGKVSAPVSSHGASASLERIDPASAEFGSRRCHMTGLAIRTPADIRLPKTVKMKSAYFPPFGTSCGRGAKITLRHLEDMDIVSPVHHMLRQEAGDPHPLYERPVVPRWVGVENESVWQIAANALIQKMLFERNRRGTSVAGKLCTVIPPPKTYTDFGFDGGFAVNAKTDLASHETRHHHAHLSEMLFRQCPRATDAAMRLWARFTLFDHPKVSHHAWDLAKHELNAPAIPDLDKEQCRDLYAFARKAAINLEHSVLTRYETVYIQPYIGREAMDTQVQLSFVGIDQMGMASALAVFCAWRQSSLIGLYRCLAPFVVGAAAYQQLYGMNVGFVHLINVADGASITLPFTDKRPLQSRKLLHAVLNTPFVRTPPLRCLFFIPVRREDGKVARAGHYEKDREVDPFPSVWEIWSPERGIEAHASEDVELLEYLTHPAYKDVRKITWNGVPHVCRALSRTTIRGGTARSIIADIEDVAWHAAFVSGEYERELRESKNHHMLQRHMSMDDDDGSEPGEDDVDHEVNLSDVVRSMIRASESYVLHDSRPLRLSDHIHVTKLVQHASGQDPFGTDHPQLEIPDTVPSNVAQLARLYVGSVVSGHLLSARNGGMEYLNVVNTDPMLRVAIIVGWHGAASLLRSPTLT